MVYGEDNTVYYYANYDHIYPNGKPYVGTIA